jgi:glycosyltransferase involved in cell wall biosynthesis
MVIAVNARFLIKDSLEGFGNFTAEIFGAMARQHPEHQFYFLLDRPYDAGNSFPSNVILQVVSPPARHPLLWKYWFDIKIPQVLRKIKADVFVSPDGFCSLTTNVPQCLVVHDLGFLHYPEAYKKTHYRFYRHFTPKFIKKAIAIATVSEFSKQDIIAHYKTAPGKIDVVYNGARDEFKPVSFNKQESTKENYSGGSEYFLYAGAIQPRKNLVNLLKAFSIFKKRQRSEMKLVLAGRLAWKNDEFLELLKTYKYREDVILTGYLEQKELVLLMASAYALVYPSVFEGFGVPVVEAMKCEVPVLTSANTSMQEIGEDAALYFDPSNHTDMAEKLMLIYKDEDLRQSLILKGKAVARKYSWKKSAELLWGCIIKARENENIEYRTRNIE